MTEAFLKTPIINTSRLKNFQYNFYFADVGLKSITKFKSLKVAYIDENQDSNKGTNLFIHGHPTWSFLWRHLLPFSIKSGYRTIALDLPGFGRSDKPIDKDFFTFANYRTVLKNFIKIHKLNKITLFMHEWGGTLGLTLPMEEPEIFEGSVCFSSYLGNCATPISQSYSSWIEKSKENNDFNVRALMARTNRILNLAECNAYEAPFPDKKYKLALNMLPSIFPLSEEKEGYEICMRAKEWWENNNLKKSIVLGGARDPLITVDKIKMISKLISSDGLTHVINNAGHFVPEWGMEYGKELFENLEMSNSE